MGYTYIDHTADLEMIAEGSTIEELFIEAAKGMYNVMLDFSKIEKKIEREINLEEKNYENLILDFLDELLFLLDTENLVFSGFEMEIKNKKLVCKCKGEEFDSKKHDEGGLVKAITYNKLRVWKEKHKWKANIVFDM